MFLKLIKQLEINLSAVRERTCFNKKSVHICDGECIIRTTLIEERVVTAHVAVTGFTCDPMMLCNEIKRYLLPATKLDRFICGIISSAR